METISKACIMEHRLGRMKLNFKYTDIMLSSSTMGMKIVLGPVGPMRLRARDTT